MYAVVKKHLPASCQSVVAAFLGQNGPCFTPRLHTKGLTLVGINQQLAT